MRPRRRVSAALSFSLSASRPNRGLFLPVRASVRRGRFGPAGRSLGVHFLSSLSGPPSTAFRMPNPPSPRLRALLNPLDPDPRPPRAGARASPRRPNLISLTVASVFLQRVPFSARPIENRSCSCRGLSHQEPLEDVPARSESPWAECGPASSLVSSPCRSASAGRLRLRAAVSPCIAPPRPSAAGGYSALQKGEGWAGSGSTSPNQVPPFEA